jgi:hypothetical protein
MVPSFHEVPHTSSLPIRRGTPLPFVSSAMKYRRKRSRSQCPSFIISFHIVFLLQKQRSGTRERDFFEHGPLTRDWLSARKSAIIEADEWRGDLGSIGRIQITWMGIDRNGANTQYPGVYCRGLGNASSSRWHCISHRFTWVHTGGSRRKETCQ